MGAITYLQKLFLSEPVAIVTRRNRFLAFAKFCYKKQKKFYYLLLIYHGHIWRNYVPLKAMLERV